MQTEFVGRFDMQSFRQTAETSALAHQAAGWAAFVGGVIPCFVKHSAGGCDPAIDERRRRMGRTVRMRNEGEKGRARRMCFSQKFPNSGCTAEYGVEVISDMHSACISDLTINVGHQVRIP